MWNPSSRFAADGYPNFWGIDLNGHDRLLPQTKGVFLEEMQSKLDLK